METFENIIIAAVGILVTIYHRELAQLYVDMASSYMPLPGYESTGIHYRISRILLLIAGLFLTVVGIMMIIDSGF
ncbi:MAG: hypothetical protein GY839_09560 [candidate division Zixibacteria bacterium]|nr:hypothetical protein [candidate division Zixibacteria bacterium]